MFERLTNTTEAAVTDVQIIRSMIYFNLKSLNERHEYIERLRRRNKRRTVDRAGRF